VGRCSGLLEKINKHGVKPVIRTSTQLLNIIPSTKSAEPVNIHTYIYIAKIQMMGFKALYKVIQI
jgi:hypothetical protein